MRYALIALLLTSLPALAEEASTNVYVFAGGAQVRPSGAQSKAANDAELTASGFNVVSSNESSDGTSFSLGAGYRFSRHVSVEGSYTDLGQIHQYSGTFTSGATSGNRVKEWQGSAVGLAALGALPLRAGFSLLGKVSVMRLKGEHRTSTLIGVSRTDARASNSVTTPGFGLGVSYAVSPTIEVRGMFEQWRTKSGMFGAGNDLDKIQLYSLSFVYQI